MNLRQKLKNKTKNKFDFPIRVDLSEKQYNSHCVYYKQKKKLNFNKDFLKFNKDKIDSIITEVFRIIQKSEEDILYIQLEEKMYCY